MRNSTTKLFINLPVSGIKAAVADHFEMLFGDVLNQPFDEVYGRNSFYDIFIIFMSVVVKSHRITVIGVDTGSCDNRSAEVTADIFKDSVRITEVWFGINIETVRMVFIALGLHFFERMPKPGLHLIEKGCAKGIAQ